MIRGLDEQTNSNAGRVRPWVLVFIVVMSGVLASPSWVSAEDEKALKEVRSVVHKLQARYEKTKDLQAEFTQKTKVEGFSTPITSSGRLQIKRPGRLRWDYLDPSREEIYVNQDDVKMFVPEHQQVLVGKLTQMSASKAPLQLLQGIAKLDSEFDITPAPGDARGAGGLPLVNLVPRGGEGQTVRPYQAIVLEVHPKTSYIKSLTLHELSGNVSTFEFSNVKANSGIQDSVFEFTVPPGVEVVRAPTFRAP
ncbi:outer-membrane lipoprotein carrier protein [Nitrospira sp.]|nr:outer-membrane lipoprotein carrier protein [Nitrospira sp.]